MRPGLDDKRLTAWNALMISALAEAGAVLDRADYLEAARRAAAFLLDEMRDSGGRLRRTYNAGEAKLNAYLEDHAFLLEALLTLYEATFEPRWFAEARALAETLSSASEIPSAAGSSRPPATTRQLIARRKDLQDAPIPAGASSAAFGLLRLAALSGEARYEQEAIGALRLVAPLAGRHPHAFGHALQALDFQLATVRGVALVGDDTTELERLVRAQLRPHVVLAGGNGEDTGGIPLLEGRTPIDGVAAAYVCEGFACRRPVVDPSALEALLTGPAGSDRAPTA